MIHTVKILSKEKITPDVIRIVTEKPTDILYNAGQAVDVSINKQGWEKELRAFTFTSLVEDDHLEFTIKTYPSHKGVTEQLLLLSPGDELLIHDVFGDIAYKGEGIFIAGGAGVTPFIAILKQLEKQNKIGHNKLLFANKTKADIIHAEKLNKLLSKNFINVLSNDESIGYEHGYISAEMIKKYSDEHTKYYYLCGPEPMMEAIEKHLASLGVEESFIVKEKF